MASRSVLLAIEILYRAYHLGSSQKLQHQNVEDSIIPVTVSQLSLRQRVSPTIQAASHLMVLLSTQHYLSAVSATAIVCRGLLSDLKSCLLLQTTEDTLVLKGRQASICFWPLIGSCHGCSLARGASQGGGGVPEVKCWHKSHNPAQALSSCCTTTAARARPTTRMAGLYGRH